MCVQASNVALVVKPFSHPPRTFHVGMDASINYCSHSLTGGSEGIIPCQWGAVLLEQPACRPSFGDGGFHRCSRFRIFTPLGPATNSFFGRHHILCRFGDSSGEAPRSFLGVSHVVSLRVKVVLETLDDLESAHFVLELLSAEYLLFRGYSYGAVVGEPSSKVDRGNYHA